MTLDGSVVDSADGLISPEALQLVQQQQSAHSRIRRDYDRRKLALEAGGDTSAAAPAMGVVHIDRESIVAPAVTAAGAGTGSALTQQLRRADAAATAAVGESPASTSISGGASPQVLAIDRPDSPLAPSPIRTPEVTDVKRAVAAESARKDAEAVRGARVAAREAHYAAVAAARGKMPLSLSKNNE
jgi:hypothetical protein